MTKQESTAMVLKNVQEIEHLSQSDELRRLVDNGAPAGLTDALVLSDYIDKIRGLITVGVLTRMRSLQNSPLGFETDREKGYPDPILRDCLIESVIRGFAPVGNEWGIIQSRFYPKAEGLRRKLRESKGFKDLQIRLGAPDMKPSGATVQAEAKWTIHGAPREMKVEIPIRINQGMGADAVLGKAERKLLMRIYKEVTGCSFSLAEEVAEDAAAPPEDYTEEVAAESQRQLLED